MPETESASTTNDAADLGFRAAARICALPFASAKLATIAVMWLSAWQHHSAGTGIPGWSQFRQVFAYWDAQHYLLIANQGYPTKVDPTPGGQGYLWINFPGYPELIRAANFLLHDEILSGVLLAAIFEFIALVFVARLVSAERDATCARLAVWLVAFVPYGVFLTAVYAESPFLAASAACLYFMRKGRFVDASIAGACATALRITGLALLPAVALEYLLQRRRNVRPDALVIPLIALPFGLFCWYAWLHAGDALAYFHIAASPSYHRQLTPPWVGFRATLGQATSFTFGVELALGLLGFFACVGLWTWRWLRRWARVPRDVSVPWSFCLYASLVWLATASQPYWLAQGRYLIALLPILLPIVDVAARNVQRSVAVVAVSAFFMAFLTTLWAQGLFIG